MLLCREWVLQKAAIKALKAMDIEFVTEELDFALSEMLKRKSSSPREAALRAIKAHGLSVPHGSYHAADGYEDKYFLGASGMQTPVVFKADDRLLSEGQKRLDSGNIAGVDDDVADCPECHPHENL